MLSLVLSVIAGALAYMGTAQALSKPSIALSSTAGVVAFLAVLVILSRIYGTKLKGIFNEVQETIEKARDEANKIANRAQGGRLSPKLLQQKMEQVMSNAIDEAILILDKARPLYKWTILADRQVSTFKMQLYYQNKRFEEVDQLLPKCMFFDPLTIAMKMAREYQTKSEKLGDTYKKGVRKFKGEKAIILYSTYAWMLVKNKDMERAAEVLNEAKSKTVSEEIERNWQAVVNNKPGQFSNAFLGDQWYALHLEKPKQGKGRVSKGVLKNDPRVGKVKRKFR